VDHDILDSNNNKVALKFMSNKDQFQSEITAREKEGFDSQFVVDVLRCYDSDNEEFLKTQLELFGFKSYPYVLVMPQCNRDLDEIISKELDTADIDTIHSLVAKIAKCVQHMHSKGFIHGDLKPKNIMRANDKLLLIDLDASAEIHIGFSGAKVSTAYIPPEMVVLDLVTNEYVVKTSDGIANREDGCQAIIYNNKNNEDECKLDDIYLSSFSYDSPPMSSVKKATTTKKEKAFYSPVYASTAHDSWSLGMIIYCLCVGSSFFHCDRSENILHQKSLEELCEFSLSFKKKKLMDISDVKARNLVSQLLNKDPNKRPTMTEVLNHPFLSYKSTARMVGEEAEFDVFISYRVASDSDHARIIYEKLSAAGLKVWWDQKLLEFGKPWDEGFVDGLCKSRIFLPIFSRGAINHDTNTRSNLTMLTSSSPVDNFLLEQRLALELSKRGLIELISPVMIGDFDMLTGTYNNYFASGSHPNLSNSSTVIVDSIEQIVLSELDRQSLGLPLIDLVSVKSVVDSILKNQGCFIVGEKEVTFNELVVKIDNAVQSLKANQQK
jgi:serine/threonine protein kinase